ncbi:MAG: L,D-transpeptidase [Oleiphilaceae bacterium]|nr:L,D-transpeptidase [Oleiphilaceae bacterium]
MSDTATQPIALEIDCQQQRMTVFCHGRVWRQYPVSTAANGLGEENGSGRTPRGRHRVRACIGAGQPRGAVFRGRRPTGEVYDESLAARYPERDWILTRILWLCGEQPGHNRLGRVDSQRRFIYIHGTPDTEPLGQPLSHGCVRMNNDDILELFDRVRPGTPVLILPDPQSRAQFAPQPVATGR